MSWTPNPNTMPADPTFVTVAIPAHLHARFEQACDALSMLRPLSTDVRSEDIIAELGLRTAETLIQSGQASQLFAETGERHDRP